MAGGGEGLRGAHLQGGRSGRKIDRREGDIGWPLATGTAADGEGYGAESNAKGAARQYCTPAPEGFATGRDYKSS